MHLKHLIDDYIKYLQPMITYEISRLHLWVLIGFCWSVFFDDLIEKQKPKLAPFDDDVQEETGNRSNWNHCSLEASKLRMFRYF